MALVSGITMGDASSVDIVHVSEQPSVFVSLCVHWPDENLLAFLHSLSEQSYPANLIHVSVTYLGGDVRVIRDLQKTQTAYEGRFKGFDLSYTGLKEESVAHDQALQNSTDPFVMIATPNLQLNMHALQRVVARAVEDSSEIAIWELRQDRQAGLQTSLHDVDTARVHSHCVLYRRDALDQIGGFQGQRQGHLTGLDVDFQLRDSGYRVVQCAEAFYVPSSAVTLDEYNANMPIEAWLSDQFIRLRYGRMRQRFAAFARIFWRMMQGAPKRQHNYVKRAFYEGLRLMPRIVFRRGLASSFPIAGWHQDFLHVTRTQPPFLKGEHQRAPLVSVIVRTHAGHAGFLKECLRSIANQSYPHLEVILVEGGATGVAKAYAGEPLFGEGVDVLYLQDAEGYQPARAGNIGLAAARGAYCLVMDADNVLRADHILSLVVALEDDENALAAYAASRLVETEVLKEEPLRYREGKTRLRANKPFVRGRLKRENDLPACAVMLRTSLCQGGVLDEDLPGSEMWDLWRNLSRDGYFIRVRCLTSVCRLPRKGDKRVAYEQQLKDAKAAIFKKDEERAKSLTL